MSNYIKVKTRDFDEIEIAPKEVLTFVKGIFAFEDYSSYVLLAPMGENKFPMWLQSTENENVCFIIFNPLEFCGDYSITISEEEKKLLGADGSNDKLEFLVIAVVPEKYEETTVNLKSPIVVNTANNKALQIIVPENYPIRFPLFKREGI